MPTRLLTPRAFALAAALLFGFGAVPHTSAEAKPAHGGNNHNDGKNGKGKNGKGKNGKNGKGKNGKGKKDAGVGPFKKKDYPVSSRLRPLVLPDQMGQVGLDLGFSHVLDVTYVGLNANFDYGVGDKVDFGGSTGLILSPSVDWNKTLDLRVHYLAYDTKEFDFAPGLVVPIYLYDSAPFGVVVDLPCRYVLSDGFFLRFGQGAIPIGLSPGFGLSVVGNGGVGYQVTAPFLLFLDTSVLTLNLAPDAGITGIWETLALDLGGQYSPTKDWDVGAQLNLADTWKVEKSLFWSLSLFGRYRF